MVRMNWKTKLGIEEKNKIKEPANISQEKSKQRNFCKRDR